MIFLHNNYKTEELTSSGVTFSKKLGVEVKKNKEIIRLLRCGILYEVVDVKKEEPKKEEPKKQVVKKKEVKKEVEKKTVKQKIKDSFTKKKTKK